MTTETVAGDQAGQKPELDGVERPAIRWLETLGYTHLSGSDVGQQQEHRHLPPLLTDILRDRLLDLNPWLADVSGGVETALREVRQFGAGFASADNLMAANEAFWQNVVHQGNLQVKDEQGRLRSLRFFNPDKVSDNRFHVVDQYVGSNSEGDLFRPDLLLFVNGIPLAVIECKASHVKVSQGIRQLLAYQNSHPRHFLYNQVCVAINRNEALYGAIFTPEAFYLRYRLEPAEEAQAAALRGDALTEQDRLLWALFEPSRFLQLVTHFVLFELDDGRTIKKLPRYQQWRAVCKTLTRLTRDDQGGVVWHTQGSGKSLTMAYLARLLRAESTGLDNPSILILTDRTDLDRQISNTFRNIGLSPMKAPSVAGLEQMLSNDYGGIFTSTIQKFQERDGKPLTPQSSDDEEAENGGNRTRVRRIHDNGQFFICVDENVRFGARDEDGNPVTAKWVEQSREAVDFRVLSTKPNFYVMVDEAHRSQYGFLAAFMRASLPKAKFVAFTGTPISKKDRNTLSEFGAGDYIDTYRLDEAVADGATLPIKYKDGLSEQLVSAELDQAFKDQFGKEDDARQGKLRQALLKKRRTAKERITENSRHLVEHFLSSVKARGFKGLLVCDGRDMAVRYKDTLDAIMAERQAAGLETFESRVVISLGSITDSRTGVDQAQAASDANTTVQTIEERVRAEQKAGKSPVAVPTDEIPQLVNELFKKPYGDEAENTDHETRFNNIGLLIVSDMLLTGWDAPIVNTLYLDKPLKEHTLLQAIARVNRTRKGKNAGYIMDYYGIVSALDQALEIYGGDVKPEQIWTDIDSELPKLEAALQKVLSLLPKKHDILKDPEAYKADADLWLDPDKRLDVVEDFMAAFADFNRRLDVVLPDERGARYKPYFKTLGEIKMALRNKLPQAAYKGPLNQLESALLQQLLDDHVAADEVRSLLCKEVSIFDTQEMERLKRLQGAGSIALRKKNQLKEIIRTGLQKNPGFYGKLQEELDRLLAQEKEQRVEQAEFLKQLDMFIQRINERKAGASNAGFESAAQVGVFDYLNAEVGEAAARQWTSTLFADDMLSTILASPIWKEKKEIHQDMQKQIRKTFKGLASWDLKASRQHSAALFDILMNN
ncbi:type I restriction endonuclease subunit R [Kistimonas asteriae]|uniref:type I restriction endonuclease subunit R n=1 Tax=Kistimonas asteriae TaxID=517724 RepID=UPI001BA73C2D|nr:type I restriction endonuclease [Kistimonas asteriae]